MGYAISRMIDKLSSRALQMKSVPIEHDMVRELSPDSLDLERGMAFVVPISSARDHHWLDNLPGKMN